MIYDFCSIDQAMAKWRIVASNTQVNTFTCVEQWRLHAEKPSLFISASTEHWDTLASFLLPQHKQAMRKVNK